MTIKRLDLNRLDLNGIEDVPGAEKIINSDVVANEARAVVGNFGAAIPTNGVIDLEWGSDGTGWRLVRSIIGCHEFKKIDEDFLGDGIKRFRLKISKAGGAGPMQTRYWFYAFQITKG